MNIRTLLRGVFILRINPMTQASELNSWRESRWVGILTFALCLVSLALPAAGQGIPVPSLRAGDAPSANSSAPHAANSENESALHKRNPRYTINPSDTLELAFQYSPEFNQTVTVQPDGYITLREVGDIPAAGHTLPELRDSIKAAYSKILHDPVITVDPKDFEKPYFTVGGQVGRPGKFDYRGNVTLTEAIAMAGGFTDASKHSQVLLFRRVSDQWTEARIINVKKMLNDRDLQEDPDLRPGDMLFVPKNALSKIKPFLPTSSVGLFANPPVL
jgi:polysaccharide export outer membrane protein